MEPVVPVAEISPGHKKCPRKGGISEAEEKWHFLVHGLPGRGGVTLLGPFQGSGLSAPESSVPAPRVRSSALTCVNSPRRGNRPPASAVSGTRSWVSIFEDCPMCERPPVEPVRVEGRLICRSCTGTCTICSSACVAGDDACRECIMLLDFGAVSA